MSDFNRGFTSPLAARADMSVDAGLRAFMLGVYNKLAAGLILSAALAYVTSALPAARDLFYVVDDSGRLVGFTLLGTVLRFAPLAVILFGAFGMRNVTPKSSGIYYWTIVSLIGAGLGIWMLVYTGASVATTFLITATAFGALSLVGYTTKKDLTGMGNFLIMGLFGIIIASLVNMFLHLSGIVFIVNVLGVLIFAGLTAYDTQRLKMAYYQMGGDQAALGVMTNYGALNLYLNFINMFQFLLSFMGNRR
ncbi:MAG TPA: Bax inhibitor-1/YccA family protein [Caulobacteraceae bacterium]|nr:Bax inhibitor-1/YccA family protein [Caulobacteraceae bacterium]